jgi:glutamyl-tRNA synthetase
MTVRLRFAPSPTGYLHIGGARTALFSWMYARKHGGQFILRIEDTDTKRFVEGAVENIMSSMRWLGLEWDEGPDIGGPYGPYVQTERAALYQEWANWLVENDKAYKCFATPEELAEMREKGVPFGYDRRYRDYPAEKVAALEAAGKPYVIRFKMPLEGQTVVPDVIRGDIVFENSQINDYVLLKSNGLPTYHLAVVVDDHFMKISHVTRGDEWINTAPLHVQLWQAFGWEMPVYVHMPVILNPSGKGKLSKRTQSFTDGEYQVLVRVEEFIAAGFLPYAVTNFLTNVGWNFGDDIEKFSMEEALERFDFSGINPAPTRLPYSKLEWLNGQYIQDLTPEALAKQLKPFLAAAGYDVDFDSLLLIAPSMRTRLRRFPDALPFLEFLFEDKPLPATAEELAHKKMPLDAAAAAFTAARQFVADADEYTVEAIAAAMTAIGEQYTENGKAGPFLGKMRLAVTGQAVSPPLYESMVALGRERVLARLDAVLQLFSPG